MLDALRQRLQALQKTTGIDPAPGALPFGIAEVDDALGGGLARGALHEIAAASEAHLAAATGFALAVSSLGSAAGTPSPRARGEEWGEGTSRQAEPSGKPPHPTFSLRSKADLSAHAGRGKKTKHLIWIAEDMALIESGALYGPGLDAFGLAPERLLTVAVHHRRDLMWAMEEALRCRATAAVIGEVRHGALDSVALRRLSLAAGTSGALALLLRASPANDASTAATRWIVGAAPSSLSSPSPGWGGSAPQAPGWGDDRTKSFTLTRRAAHGDLPPPGGGERKSFGPGPPRFAAQLVRNRRGPTGSWILEWRDNDERFILATPAQPVAAPVLNRPHRKVA